MRRIYAKLSLWDCSSASNCSEWECSVKANTKSFYNANKKGYIILRDKRTSDCLKRFRIGRLSTLHHSVQTKNFTRWVWTPNWNGSNKKLSKCLGHSSTSTKNKGIWQISINYVGDYATSTKAKHRRKHENKDKCFFIKTKSIFMFHKLNSKNLLIAD